jgi:hypothetical protein
VRDFTGLPVNHVALVDFGNFKNLIDKIGGITVNVPAPILCTFFRLPFIGGDLLKPLATDLTAGQLLQLGWVKFRGHTLRCRIGGTPENIGGGSYLQPDEEARAVIAMVKGVSAPQPPLPGSTFGSGCLSG